MTTHPVKAGAQSAADPESGSGIVVRTATLDDLDIVVELRIALVREHRDNPLYARLRADAPALARRYFAAQLRSPDEVVFLAERDGEALGILRCVQARGLPLISPSLHGYISSVYVVPAERRHGVLRVLFASAVEWCRARGLTEIRLHNAAENVAANATWEALGFQVAEHLRVRRLT